MKPFYKVGDVLSSSEAWDSSYRWTVAEVHENHLVLKWNGGESEPIISTKDKWYVFKIESRGPIVGPNGEHNCAEHLELAKGFRFDYHYCTLCGSKQHTA